MHLDKTMKELIKLLTIDKEFVFHGQLEDLRKILGNSKDMNYMNLSERELTFTPTVSWGTLSMGGVSFGINVQALFTEESPDRLRVNFKTRIRPEHYFIIVLFIFFFVGITFSNESKLMILYVVGLWIICHAWFQFIDRLQENYLVDKVAKKLRLLWVR